MGYLIAIEGVDGSGKQTQSRLLYERMKKIKDDTLLISFPDYKSLSSGPVKMYLNGEFGDNAKDVNAYIASTFYAVDRYASFMSKWKNIYEDGGFVIADRYASANMIHQASKISDIKERDEFLNWLYKLEYEFYKIPVPDIVFFLDVPLEYRKNLVSGRKNKITGDEKQDIHEKDASHIKESYMSSFHVIEKYNWVRINCIKDGKLRSIEDINQEIFDKVNELIKNEINKK